MTYVYHTDPSKIHNTRRKSKYCPRYYRYGNRLRVAQVIRKLKYTKLTRMVAFTATKDNTSINRFKVGTDAFTIGIDTHASYSMSNNKAHFISEIKSIRNASIVGVSGTLPIKGIGTVRWKVNDDSGRQHIFEIPGTMYVPKLTGSMLSPQHWSKGMQNVTGQRAWESTSHDGTTLHWNNGKYQRTIKLNANTNTPIMLSSEGSKQYQVYEAIHNAVNNPKLLLCKSSIVHDNTNNEIYEQNMMDLMNEDSFTKKDLQILTAHDEDKLQMADPKAELLRWHYRLGHVPFKVIRLLAAANILPRHLLDAKVPKCAACQYGAMTRKPWRTKAPPGKIKPTLINRPGDCISIDQMESSMPGFMAQIKGRLTRRRYRYCTVFVDHHSRLKYVHLQETLSSDDTVKAKQAFEAYAAKHGVKVQHYHADNGRFADKAFVNHATEQGQDITYCSVNAHFQNGIAEKAIRDLQEQARKQLLHARARWPEVIHLALWPYAMRNAALVSNLMPSQDGGVSPLEIFTGSQVAPNFRHLHTFGCPVYALNNALQAGRTIPKWQSRARLGVNLGSSPRHGRQTSLVLNPITGLVSPQYHISHDDYFETTASTSDNPPTHSVWQQLSGLNVTKCDKHVGTPIYREAMRRDDYQQVERNVIAQPTIESTAQVTIGQHVDHPNVIPNEETDDAPLEETTASSQSRTRGTQLIHRPTSRFGRRRRLTDRMREAMEQRAFASTLAVIEDSEPETETVHPLCLLSTVNKDTMYFHEAIKQPDAPQFVDAIIKEINDHVNRKHWQLVPRDHVPPNQPILPSVWSMKRKRNLITKQVYKWKARLNIHGGKQQYGVNYTETFSPVVNWITIRLILILSIIHKWKTRQVDFVLAFPQAKIECEMYMELPQGVEMRHGRGKTHVLRLLKNLYGQKQAGRVWNKHLHAKLSSIGFQQSKYDDCLYYRGTTMFAVYVDDGIFASPNDEDINQAINDLRSIHCDIEDQGELSDYLGVNIKQNQGVTYLTQPHLIDQIIEDTGISRHASDKLTPAASTIILGADKEGKEFDYNFDYRSVVGKLNFLEKSTRPDIAYAVHQCARFASNPRKSHGDAIIHLAKYLRNTREKGLILSPSAKHGLEVYADADFSGSWIKHEAQDDPDTAKSRSGYAIKYAECLLTWKSKLQTIIALSSTEAEYVSLSQSMREAIPIMGLLEELQSMNVIPKKVGTKVKCKAFEDNSGAIELARLPKMRPRTKHINISYHHFRSFITDGSISVEPISTHDQVADLLTKPLPQNQFLKLRKRLLGY